MARSPAQRVIGTLLFLAALVALVGFYFLVFAESQQIDAVPGVGDLPLVALAVGVLLAIVAVALIMLLASGGRQREDESDDRPYFVPPEPSAAPAYEARAFEEVDDVDDDDLVVYDVWRLPQARKAWAMEERGQSTFYFPLHVEGGVYVNDYIPIESRGDRRLKLRTLLAGPPDIEAAAFTIPGASPRADRMEAPRRPERPERSEGLQRPERPEREEPRRPERPSPDVPGDHFMRELERRFAEGDNGQVAVTTEGSYLDYTGDVHDVLDVEGIGPAYAAKLREMGIHTTARLCYEDTGSIARGTGVPQRTVESWKDMAQLMKVNGIGPQYAEALVRSGIDMEGLRRGDPAQMADQINAHLETLGVSVVGQRITERRVATWQDAAKAMRRERLRVPEK